jgi:hypothetical protein
MNFQEYALMNWRLLHETTALIREEINQNQEEILPLVDEMKPIASTRQLCNNL